MGHQAKTKRVRRWWAKVKAGLARAKALGLATSRAGSNDIPTREVLKAYGAAR